MDLWRRYDKSRGRNRLEDADNLLGFSFGSTNNPQYNGQYFADEEDVVLVSIR
jgi:hypothetical protein